MKLTTEARLWGVSLLGGVGVLLFWALGFPAMLSYHEQMQLFLSGSDFFLSRIAAPAGAAQYASEFLMQFGLFAWAGAAVMAVIFVLTQRLVWRMMRSSNLWSYALSFVPPILLLLAHGNDNVMLCSDVAVVLALVASVFCPQGFVQRAIYLALAVPVVYWLAGPAVWILVIYAGAESFAKHGRMRAVVLFVVAALYALVLQLVAARCLPYMLGQIVRGISYFRFPLTISPMLVVSLAAFAVVPSVCFFIKKIKNSWRLLTIECAAVVALTAVFTPLAYKADNSETLHYVYLLRNEKWNDIISRAEKKSPKSVVAMSAVNLALAKTNQLGNRLFDFGQDGIECLIPIHQLKPSVTLAAQEVYFHIGLVNEAQRFAFDSMETPSNGIKSARLLKRLAETNLVNGDYDVAMKYLLLLRKTLFYSHWANETLPLLHNEEAINAHPLYGWLRRARLRNDFLYSESEVDKMIGQVFLQNPKNTIAMQYLMAFPLLRRDMPAFLQYLDIVLEKVDYQPRSVREALAYVDAQQDVPLPKGWNLTIEQNRIRDFANTLQAFGQHSPRLDRHKNTAWFYLSKKKVE